MINLKTLFKNHLASKEISDDELMAFSQDHLARITANNHDGILDPIIGATGAAHIACFGAISDEDVAAAVRQGMTINVDRAIAAFKKLVQRREGAIRSAFGEDGPEYQEFFPHGMTEYSQATKENIEVLMNRFATAAATYAARLERGLPELFTAARDAYQPLRKEQLGKKGDVSGKKTTAAATRNTLELQLTGNMHFIGWRFPGNEQHCLTFFDQSILRNRITGTHGEDDEQPPA